MLLIVTLLIGSWMNTQCELIAGSVTTLTPTGGGGFSCGPARLPLSSLLSWPDAAAAPNRDAARISASNGTNLVGIGFLVMGPENVGLASEVCMKTDLPWSA